MWRKEARYATESRSLGFQIAHSRTEVVIFRFRVQTDLVYLIFQLYESGPHFFSQRIQSSIKTRQVTGVSRVHFIKSRVGRIKSSVGRIHALL